MLWAISILFSTGNEFFILFKYIQVLIFFNNLFPEKKYQSGSTQENKKHIRYFKQRELNTGKQLKCVKRTGRAEGREEVTPK